MKVRDCMTTEVCSITADESLELAAQRMWEGDCGCLPVLNADQQVVAVITDRDVCMGAYTQGRALRDIPVACSMSQSLYCCGPDESLESAESIMSAHQVRRLPVVGQDGRLQGMLSLGDLARTVALGGESQRRVQREELARTLEAISQAARATLQPQATKKAVDTRAAPRPRGAAALDT